MNLDECPLDPVEEREDFLVFVKDGERVELVYDSIVDDWIVRHYIGNGVGGPGGVRYREKAIEYAMYLLNEVDETDARPVERC